MNTKSVASSALTVAACILCTVLVMRPTVVSGASMMPTLHDKDVLITSPLAKRLFEPNSWRDRYHLLVCKSSVWVCFFGGYTIREEDRCSTWRRCALWYLQYFRVHQDGSKSK